MTLPLMAAMVVVVAGGILCVAGRDARTIAAGLFLALGAAPLLADPLPDLVPLAARIAAAAIVAELAWIALRDRPDAGPGSQTGRVAQSMFAAAAVTVALGLHDPATQLGAPDLARAAGFALLVVAVPGMFGGAPARTGVAVVLLVAAALLLQVALTMEPTPFAQLLASLVEVAAAGGMIVVLQLSAIRPPETPAGQRGSGSYRRAVGPFDGQVGRVPVAPGTDSWPESGPAARRPGDPGATAR